MVLEVLMFASIAVITALPMFGATLSDDQVTYWSKARIVLQAEPGHVWWDPINTYSFALAFLCRWIGEPSAVFAVTYVATAFLYLLSFYWVLRRLLGCASAAMIVSIASLVPRYTLGMTYWGFGGFEFVKARMLIMPFVPLIFYFFVTRSRRSVASVAVACCAVVALLNFEAIYLGAVLSVYVLLFVLPDRSVPARDRLVVSSGVAAFLGGAGILYGYRIVMEKFLGQTATLFELPVYERLGAALRDQVLAMSDAEYLKLAWEAAYRAFWWTMFPPRITDTAFFFAEHVCVVAMAVMGWIGLKKDRPELARMLWRISLAVLIAAYGMQTVRWCGRYAFGWPPLIFEEVRAFKFILFPMYVSACFFIAQRSRGKIWSTVALGAVLAVSPVQMARALPADVKQVLVAAGERSLPAEKLSYLSKILGLHDPWSEKDIRAIAGVLGSAKSAEEDTYVLTTDHRIKYAGLASVVSYQDKRADYAAAWVDEVARRSSPLVFWDIAFREISGAIASRDPQELYRVSGKYGCSFAVVDFPVTDARFEEIYAGRVLNCYRVRPMSAEPGRR